MKFWKSGAICLVTLAATFFYACSDNDPVLATESTHTVYERMGQLHNEGLDYVLDKIVKTSPATKSGGRVIPEMSQLRNWCAEFAASEGHGISTRSIATEIVADPLDWSAYPEERQHYLQQLKKITRKATPDRLAELTGQIKNLENRLKADSRISPEEQDVLLNVMAVCRHSALYWAENYTKWQVELYGVAAVRSLKTRSEVIISKKDWEKYGALILADGAGGIYNGQYILTNSSAASIAECF